MTFDCRTCGACCVEFKSIMVRPEDSTPRYRTRSVRRRMGYTREDGENGIREMRLHFGGRCQALKGVVGKNCACGIYDRRPKTCRDFQPGSDSCLFARDRMHSKMSCTATYRGYGENWKETIE